jgi:hypothetical protein
MVQENVRTPNENFVSVLDKSRQQCQPERPDPRIGAGAALRLRLTAPVRNPPLIKLISKRGPGILQSLVPACRKNLSDRLDGIFYFL